MMLTPLFVFQEGVDTMVGQGTPDKVPNTPQLPELRRYATQFGLALILVLTFPYSDLNALFRPWGSRGCRRCLLESVHMRNNKPS